jgi:hypothetical protein
MDGPFIKVEREKILKKSLGKLFSVGKIRDKIRLLNNLGSMPGLNLFMTAVPWRITFSEKAIINGLSETMQLALRDIQAHLIYFATAPSEMVTIEVDEARLPPPSRENLLPASIEGL